MDRRPKPPEPPPAAADSKAPGEAAETSEAGSSALLPDVAMTSDATLEVGSDLAVGSPNEADEIADVVAPEPPVEAPAQASPEAVALASTSEAVVADGAAAAAESEIAPEGVVASPGAGEDNKDAAPEEVSATLAEPVMIEVWLPGRALRPEGARRPRPRREHRRDAARGTPQPQSGDGVATPAVAAAETGGTAPQTADGAPGREGRHSRRRRGGQGHGERHGERHGGERHAGERHAGDQRQDRPSRDRDRGNDRGHGKRFERRERDKAPDPNSPFAKLAALKAQLEADAKERR